MHLKSKKRMPISPIVRELKEEKALLFEELVQIQTQYDGIAESVIDDVDNWINGLSIDSLHSLEPKESGRTCLGDFRAREFLRGEMDEIKRHLESVNTQIRTASLDFIELQIKKLDVKLNESKI